MLCMHILFVAFFKCPYFFPLLSSPPPLPSCSPRSTPPFPPLPSLLFSSFISHLLTPASSLLLLLKQTLLPAPSPSRAAGGLLGGTVWPLPAANAGTEEEVAGDLYSALDTGTGDPSPGSCFAVGPQAEPWPFLGHSDHTANQVKPKERGDTSPSKYNRGDCCPAWTRCIPRTKKGSSSPKVYKPSDLGKQTPSSHVFLMANFSIYLAPTVCLAMTV